MLFLYLYFNDFINFYYEILNIFRYINLRDRKFLIYIDIFYD